MTNSDTMVETRQIWFRKAKFVSLKDGQSKIVFQVSADKRGVEIGEIKLALENPLQQASIAEVAIEALDTKTKAKKKAVFNPHAPNSANPIPAVIVLGNLMLLKPLRGLTTDQISIAVRKAPKSKLSLRLTVKACAKLTTPIITSECECECEYEFECENECEFECKCVTGLFIL